jgi:predicted DNA-binding transcriptional regulator AlpA
MKQFQLTVNVGGDVTEAVAEVIRQAVSDNLAVLVEAAVQSAMEKARPAQLEEPRSPSMPSQSTSAGVSLTPLDKTSARELRAAYLLGHLPENGSLLIDTKQVSKLLNISPRTIFRLHQEKAMPEPIRLGTRIQWRVRELIEWVEADCPPQRSWKYSEGHGTTTRKR